MNDPQREAFFNQLYSQYHRVVFAYLLTHVSHRETAKDLLQEAFLRIWNQINVGFELGLNESRYWIYRIAKNLVVDYYRRRSTQNRTQERIKADAVANPTASRSAEEIFETKERSLDIEQAIRRLPEELQRVLTLQFVGQMNSTEIGELLDIPAGTVRYRLCVARKQLRHELAQAQGEGVHP
jgi:RNA polymerase sigma-70 factor (ECF subfamily)